MLYGVDRCCNWVVGLTFDRFKMYYVEDENFARRLQDEDQAYENFRRQKEEKEKENLNPVDSALEYIDPTPSIHDLFVKFDKKFFWNKLGMVEVVWSNKMTRCAGVCSFQGRAGLCKIALSAPLLSLRPRKDLVETLLHEMIHAYLFVTRNFKDREDHGPEFHKHMFRINKEAGTKITVYHSFNDEVDYYQKHVWRCNGPCQQRKPYFGLLRRAVNRPPGPSDPWWEQHKAECGGTYIKISEPEKPVKKSRKILSKPGEKHKDIREYFNRIVSSKGGSQSSNIRTLADIKEKGATGMKVNAGTGTIVLTNVKGKKSGAKRPEMQNPVNKSKNVNTGSVKMKKESEGSSSLGEDGYSQRDVREAVRNVWANKFKSTKPPSPKRAKLQCPVCREGFLEEEIQSHVDECLKNNSCDVDKNSGAESSNCGISNNSVGEISKCDMDNNVNCDTYKNLKKSNYDETDEYRDCPVCGEKTLQSEMNDHLENCLNCSFVNEGDDGTEIMCESVPCPCCYKWFLESDMNGHIDECLTLSSLKQEILTS